MDFGEARSAPHAASGRVPIATTTARAKYRALGVKDTMAFVRRPGAARVKESGARLRMNQKPLQLLMRIIRSSSDPGDVA